MDTSHQKIFVIGASAGGIEPLKTILSTLDESFSGTIFIVLHLVFDRGESKLDQALQSFCKLPVKFVDNETTFRKGEVYLAQGNTHLVLDSGNIARSTSGPRENRSRPAIDPLFRTAAVHYNSSVVATILSGKLDDGTAGIVNVKQCGGTAIIQDIEEADSKEMPSSVKEVLGADLDFELTSVEIGQKFLELAKTEVPTFDTKSIPEKIKKEAMITSKAKSSIELQNELGHQVPFICPECDGPLWKIEDAKTDRFRCHTGHAHTLKSLSIGQRENLEHSLWAALRQLEEHAKLLETLMKSTKKSSSNYSFKSLEKRRKESLSHAEHLRNFLLNCEENINV